MSVEGAEGAQGGRGGSEGAGGGGRDESGRATAGGAAAGTAAGGNSTTVAGASPGAVTGAGGVDGAVSPDGVDGSGVRGTPSAGSEPSEQATRGEQTVREGREHPDEGGGGGEKEHEKDGGNETRRASSSQQGGGETPSIPRAGLLRLLRKEGPLRRNVLASEAVRPILTDRDFTKVTGDRFMGSRLIPTIQSRRSLHRKMLHGPVVVFS